MPGSDGDWLSVIPDARHPKVAIVAHEHRVMRHVGQLPDELATAIEPLQAISVEVEDDIAIRQKYRAVYLRVPVVLGQKPALYVLRIRPDPGKGSPPTMAHCSFEIDQLQTDRAVFRDPRD